MPPSATPGAKAPLVGGDERGDEGGLSSESGRGAAALRTKKRSVLRGSTANAAQHAVATFVCRRNLLIISLGRKKERKKERKRSGPSLAPARDAYLSLSLSLSLSLCQRPPSKCECREASLFWEDAGERRGNRNRAAPAPTTALTTAPCGRAARAADCNVASACTDVYSRTCEACSTNTFDPQKKSVGAGSGPLLFGHPLGFGRGGESVGRGDAGNADPEQRRFEGRPRPEEATSLPPRRRRRYASFSKTRFSLGRFPSDSHDGSLLKSRRTRAIRVSSRSAKVSTLVYDTLSTEFQTDSVVGRRTVADNSGDRGRRRSDSSASPAAACSARISRADRLDSSFESYSSSMFCVCGARQFWF